MAAPIRPKKVHRYTVEFKIQSKRGAETESKRGSETM